MMSKRSSWCQKYVVTSKICYLFRPISQKRCMLWPMFVWSTYAKSYDLSICIVTFDLGLPLNVKSRSQIFQGVVSHKWCIIWSKFVWNTVIYGLSVYLITFDLWWNWKGKSRSLGFQRAIFHKLSTFWPSFIINTYRK